MSLWYAFSVKQKWTGRLVFNSGTAGVAPGLRISPQQVAL
jgi:hypothetical protein